MTDSRPTRWTLTRSDGAWSLVDALSGAASRLSLTQLRWISVGVPVAALAVLMHLTAFALPQVFQTPLGYVTSVVLLLVAVVAFSHFVFSVIERLERRITRQNARLSIAASVASVLSEPGDPAATMERVLADVCGPLGADAGVIRLIDARTGSSIVAQRGLSPYQERRLGVIPLQPDRASLIEDASVNPATRDLATDLGLRCLLLVPLVAHGSSEGSLMVAGREPGAFNEEDRLLLEQVARQVGLAAQRSSLLGELVDRNEELRLLNDHSAALSSADGLSEVLDVVLGTLVEVSASQSGDVWLEEAGALELVDRKGSGTLGQIQRTSDPEAVVAAATEEPRARLLQLQQVGASLFETSDGATHGWLPLRAGGHISGAIHLIRRPSGEWSDRRRRLLETIADQGGVAVSDAQQRERARAAAVLEERGRIAREMHDGPAQILGYLNTKTYAIRRLLDAGDAVKAELMLADLEEAARDASVDIRENLLALRSTDSIEQDLLGCIASYVDRFQRLSGISVDYQVAVGDEEICLSEMAGLQVMRMIQEALSNVRKHSGVQRATLSIGASSEALDVRIDDDGCGFDPGQEHRSDQPSFGLATMRERAEAVGGRLSVTSTPGQGTHVSAVVPMARHSVGTA